MMKNELPIENSNDPRLQNSEENFLRDNQRFLEFHKSVSYAGNVRPDYRDVDPDKEAPGDEKDDEGGNRR